MIAKLFLAACLLLVLACSKTPQETTTETPTTDAEKHLWDAQTEALEKAKKVEQLLQDAQAERAEQLDQDTP